MIYLFLRVYFEIVSKNNIMEYSENSYFSMQFPLKENIPRNAYRRGKDDVVTIFTVLFLCLKMS